MFNNHKSSVLLVFLLSGTLLFYTFGQEEYLNNPSLDEGLTVYQNIQIPYYWYSCQMWSDPDYFNGEGSLNPVDGTVFARMRTRAFDYYDGGYHDPSTTEYMVNRLVNPIEANNCYRFTVYLAYTPDVESNTYLDDKTSHPLRFEIRATNDSCPSSMDEIETYPKLAVTNRLVENNSFERYELNFTVQDSFFRFLLVRPIWDTNYIPTEYNGIIAVDNMSLRRLRYVDPLPQNILYYKRIPPLQLRAADGYSWEWSPSESLSNPFIKDPIMLAYDSMYVVTIRDEAGCPVYQRFNIVYICDTIYKTDFFRDVDIYYHPDDEQHLSASNGVDYQWDETVTGLSDYHIQQPVITDHFVSITVAIHDNSDDHCLFYERFQMIYNCDSIISGIETVFFDTILYGEEIILDPGEGTLYRNWTPPEGLSQENILTPVASPKEKTIYTVGIIRDYNYTSCVYNKYFHIELDLEIPNVITPNDNNGYNDVFKIPGLSENAEITIFDKSGKIIFKEKPYNESNWWKGTYLDSNMKVPSGNYWYILEDFERGETFTGFILVVR